MQTEVLDNCGVPIGITLDGFKQFLIKELADNGLDIDKMFVWLANLGFDDELYQTRSRAFNLTIHSQEHEEEDRLRVQMKDALLTNLDFTTN